MALGMEQAGILPLLLNESDKHACSTLHKNRPDWDILQDDIRNINFFKFRDQVDIVSGGFPCQPFSYAGKKLGVNDSRGSLFFEYIRVIKEVRPKICIAENVKGLFTHNNGSTLDSMLNSLRTLGYTVPPPRVLKAIKYGVPQKRERLFIVAIREDIKETFYYPEPNEEVYTLKDALKKGKLYDINVPFSKGQEYPEGKKEVLDQVPPGGCWRDLPISLQKEYMLKSFYQGGGRTGIARRLSWDEPCLTLTCSPAQKRTERCYPDETRPLQVREYARIQTFPDTWEFCGPISQQYKQIGNAVPVNLAKKLGHSVVTFLNKYYKCHTKGVKYGHKRQDRRSNNTHKRA